MQNFADRLDQAIEKKSSCLVVGLDPVLERLPGEVLAEVGVPAQREPGWTARAASATGLFLTGVIDSVAPQAVAVARSPSPAAPGSRTGPARRAPGRRTALGPR